jgi:metallo-beta-lactamase family protein
LSAHADQCGLLAWYGHFRSAPALVLVHGEERAREALAGEIDTHAGVSAVLAYPGMEMEV